MNTFMAVQIVEGQVHADVCDVLAAWQYLVDSSDILCLQGSMQRKAQELIEDGDIDAGEWQ